jgi:hypothetical protein
MTSQLGYLPKEMKSLANGIQVPTDGTVLYANPVGFHQALVASGATTLTAAQFLGGLVVMDPDGANNLTLPSAADIVAAGNGLAVGSTFRLTVLNQAGGAEAITVVVGTGITNYADGTVTSTLTVGQNAGAEFLLVFTNVDPGDEAATLYCVNTSAAVNA